MYKLCSQCTDQQESMLYDACEFTLLVYWYEIFVDISIQQLCFSLSECAFYLCTKCRGFGLYLLDFLDFLLGMFFYDSTFVITYNFYLVLGCI